MSHHQRIFVLSFPLFFHGIYQIQIIRLIAAAGCCESYGIDKDAVRQRELIHTQIANDADDRLAPGRNTSGTSDLPAVGHSRPPPLANADDSTFASLFQQWQSSSLSYKDFLFSLDRAMIAKRRLHQPPEGSSVTADVIRVVQMRRRIEEQAYCYGSAARVSHDNNIVDPDLQDRIVHVLQSVCIDQRERY